MVKKFTPCPKPEPKAKEVKKKVLKDKVCKFCNCKFAPERSLQRVCGYNCAVGQGRSDNLRKETKDRKQAEKEARDWKSEGLEKLKSLKVYEAEARRVFQKYIRMRDIADPCISCGTTESEIWDGSHLFKAELYTGLIFNEMNVHKACRKCNYYLGGNEAGYKDGLIKRYGEQYLKDIESIKDSARSYKFSKEELINIKEIYKRKLKEI